MFSLIMGFWKMLFKKSEYQSYRQQTSPARLCVYAVPMLTCVLTQALLGFSHAVLSEVLEDQEHINGLEPFPPGKIPPPSASILGACASSAQI